MDKLSLNVLKHIAAAQPERVSRSAIIEKFGQPATNSLSFLEKEDLIRSGRIPVGVGGDLKPIFGSDGRFSVTSAGLSFLEEKPGKDFDRWLTRVVAIWGAITGTAALVLEIVLHSL